MDNSALHEGVLVNTRHFPLSDEAQAADLSSARYPQWDNSSALNDGSVRGLRHDDPSAVASMQMTASRVSVPVGSKKRKSSDDTKRGVAVSSGPVVSSVGGPGVGVPVGVGVGVGAQQQHQEVGELFSLAHHLYADNSAVKYRSAAPQRDMGYIMGPGQGYWRDSSQVRDLNETQQHVWDTQPDYTGLARHKLRPIRSLPCNQDAPKEKKFQHTCRYCGKKTSFHCLGCTTNERIYALCSSTNYDERDCYLMHIISQANCYCSY